MSDVHYHCSIKRTQRSKGENAVAAAAYRAAAKLYNERTGQTHDYTRKDGVLHTEILAPDIAPDWVYERERLWNNAEHAEGTRKNAISANEAEIAFPHFIPREDMIALARDYAGYLMDRYNGVVDIAIHAPGKGGDQRNFHAHILFSSREITPDGFSTVPKKDQKPTILNARGAVGNNEIRHLREVWSGMVNALLKERGYTERTDHRSYQDREIDREPTVHLGPSASALERLGIDTERGAINREINRQNLDRMLEKLTYYKATFTEKDLKLALFDHGYDTQEKMAAAIADLYREEILIALAHKETGVASGFFTSSHVRQQEEAVMQHTQTLQASVLSAHRIAEKKRQQAIEDRQLDDEQAAALNHALGEGAIKVIEGRAGTGKTHTIGAIREAAEQSGLQVIGMAPTNSVADDLRKDGFSESRTAHSLLWHIKHATGQVDVGKRTVMILDEAAMADTLILEQLTALAVERQAKLILVGDDRQLSSVQRGGLFTEIKNTIGSAVMSTVRRQREDWQRQASMDFSDGDFLQGLNRYEEAGLLHWGAETTDSRQALVAQWENDTEDGIGERFVFAYTNKEVNRLNRDLQAIQVARGEVNNIRDYETAKGAFSFGKGDRIQFTGTDKRLGIINGLTGRVHETAAHEIAVVTDDAEIIRFDPRDFKDFSLGYAGTIYRGQGKTLDQSYLLHSYHWRSDSSYVALTRTREEAHVFASRAEVGRTEDLHALARQMSRSSDNHASLQYDIVSGRERSPQAERDLYSSWQWDFDRAAKPPPQAPLVDMLKQEEEPEADTLESFRRAAAARLKAREEQEKTQNLDPKQEPGIDYDP